ncbi:hypothetical protein H5410_045759 [Solanum commersonii]|uniref:DUF7745 domain-containing protein n=1 Tax=Solanum commersonii TaxID=4109 RepID=A0A9J5XCI2_SOLCO|nr:hypothetical protein H5410_045759 [Solanum commersonii]
MSLVPQVPKVRMVEGFPHKLRTWWENFTPTEKLAITRRLGCLPLLFKITPDKHVIRALIQFWDPDHVVLVFKDFELTPTLEEILYFTSLKYQRMGQIIPHSQSGKKFFRYLGLKNEKKLRCFENNWVCLDYLYERYGRSDSYKLFRKEFSCTQVHWQVRRPIAFVVALLGTLGVDDEELTVVPMILVEIFQALGKYKKGESNFFDGCNLLLQIWAMEHFHQRKNMDDICFSNINHINSFYDRMKEFVYSIGIDDWYEFLAHRTSLQPYAPVRVLQQFGQA